MLHLDIFGVVLSLPDIDVERASFTATQVCNSIYCHAETEQINAKFVVEEHENATRLVANFAVQVLAY